MNNSFKHVMRGNGIKRGFAFYYAFDDYDSNVIKSDNSTTGIGYSGLSGNIVNYAGQTLNDFTGASGSGHFSAGYIELPNTENFNPKSFSTKSTNI